MLYNLEVDRTFLNKLEVRNKHKYLCNKEILLGCKLIIPLAWKYIFPFSFHDHHEVLVQVELSIMLWA